MSLGLYVHLPFCRVHCTYCPFAISTDLELQERYVDALVREIAGSSSSRMRAESVYFGGGTPSRTSVANLGRVVEALHERFEVTPGAEFSMEANPEDITGESVEAWQRLGVNRLSIGVQSFVDEELRVIGRVHDAARAQAAIRIAVASGLRTSLDLILGLPRQTAAGFAATLDTAMDSGAGHISLYMLDLEETTPLQVQVSRGRVRVPDDEIVAGLYREAIERLERAGFRQYEISNFARPEEECRHNLRYWDRGEYRGFGIAAHSLMNEQRSANTRNIKLYIDGPEQARDFQEQIGDGERRREEILLNLRQAAGIIYEKLVQLCGQEGIEWADRGLRDGWLRRMDGRVAFTPSGFLLSNEYISQLF